MIRVCYCGHAYDEHAPKVYAALAAWPCETEDCPCPDFVEREPDGTVNFADYDPNLDAIEKGKW